MTTPLATLDWSKGVESQFDEHDIKKMETNYHDGFDHFEAIEDPDIQQTVMRVVLHKEDLDSDPEKNRNEINANDKSQFRFPVNTIRTVQYWYKIEHISYFGSGFYHIFQIKVGLGSPLCTVSIKNGDLSANPGDFDHGAKLFSERINFGTYEDLIGKWVCITIATKNTPDGYLKIQFRDTSGKVIRNFEKFDIPMNDEAYGESGRIRMGLYRKRDDGFKDDDTHSVLIANMSMYDTDLIESGYYVPFGNAGGAAAKTCTCTKRALSRERAVRAVKAVPEMYARAQRVVRLAKVTVLIVVLGLCTGVYWTYVQYRKRKTAGRG
ncbi:hypothetical protein SARC_00079 [Sphaeroforma arctica JP610]|uniref:Legume lectin domain-containing protein n=1 Tax=Sphaeroforma arctica JP610 TaxID=667725 RepID=A0A0L0GFL6_9EUKA|nr:hypothetical protein SARC_00079 [Sphaeroforma arctica JP610]KNC87822.1 hypothetical protein SARC_00079 [Sphaeroforma arctica JP610]|eukprot:XP_014161724.1 hypothetical protein SARC_00079 [Sphaeroforma arctica JP610]